MGRAAPILIALAAVTAATLAVVVVGFSGGRSVRPKQAQRGGTAQPLSIGVDLATGFYVPSAVTQFSSLISHRINIVQNFVSWEFPADPSASLFPSGRASQILAEGAVPEITWDPSIAGAPVEQPQMNLATIIAGRFDPYIRSFADAAAAMHGAVLIRFAHEMNGPWTSYYVNNSGNRPGEFVAAWRHVHDIFVAAGAHNVRWVWSPNIASAGDTALAALYPGNSYVDWVGVDGYSYPKAGCQTAAQIFDNTLAEVARFSDRPQMLAEVGIDATCPNKPALIRNLFQWLTTRPRIRAITWWERRVGGDDWTVNSSAAALTAFRSGLQSLTNGE